MKLSVVVPCYNEEECVEELHRRIKKACDESEIQDSYEIVLVNDGSSDSTLFKMQTLSKKDERLVIVDLSRNHGHQLALTAGLSVSKGKQVFIIDADLQDPPEHLQPMLDIAKKDKADVVYGQRTSREGESFFKIITAVLFYRLLSLLTKTNIPSDCGDFRLMSRRITDRLLSMPERQRFIRGMISWIGYKQVAYPYDRDKRYAGSTKYPFWKMLEFSIDAITSFSIRPLQIILPLALFCTAIAGLLMLKVVLAAIFKDTVPGWASLATIFLFFTSIQLICIGFIAEYIGRIYMQVKQRPLFIIRDIYKKGRASKPKN
jgi:dolichol-phosphate mannosyltransferase